MGVASGCGEQEVGVASGSRWNLWVWLLGVVVRRYIDFLTSCICTFLQQHPYFFVHFLKCFSLFDIYIHIYTSLPPSIHLFLLLHSSTLPLSLPPFSFTPPSLCPSLRPSLHSHLSLPPFMKPLSALKQYIIYIDSFNSQSSSSSITKSSINH